MAISAVTNHRDLERNEIIDQLQFDLQDRRTGEDEIIAAKRKVESAGVEVDRCLEELAELENAPFDQDIEPERNQIADRLQTALKDQVTGQDEIITAKRKVESARRRVGECLKKLVEL